MKTSDEHQFLGFRYIITRVHLWRLPRSCTCRHAIETARRGARSISVRNPGFTLWSVSLRASLCGNRKSRHLAAQRKSVIERPCVEKCSSGDHRRPVRISGTMVRKKPWKKGNRRGGRIRIRRIRTPCEGTLLHRFLSSSPTKPESRSGKTTALWLYNAAGNVGIIRDEIDIWSNMSELLERKDSLLKVDSLLGRGKMVWVIVSPWNDIFLCVESVLA